MTRILDLPKLGWDFTVGNNEDWNDASYQHLDSTGSPIPFDGIGLQFMMRRDAFDPVVILSASTSGQIGGVATAGLLVTAPGVWAILVPRSTMLQIEARSYVWEVQASAEETFTIGAGAVTVVEGIVR